MTEPEDVALNLYNEGRAAADRGELHKAVELLEASTWLQPHFKTLEILGKVLVRLGSYQRATVYLAAAAGLAPKQVPARLALAELFASHDEIHDARTQLEEVLRVNPQSRSAAELMERLPPETD